MGTYVTFRAKPGCEDQINEAYAAMTGLNFNRMTIRDGQVFKVKRVQIGGYATDMGAKKFAWIVSGAAKPLFAGTQDECLAYIANQGAEYQALP